MSEYITLVNNVKTFDNTMSDFRTKLGKIVKLDGNWLVGLSEITYTKSWYNLLYDHKITLFDEMGQTYGEKSNIYDNQFTISAGFYESPMKLISAINKILSSFTQITPPKLIYNEINNYVILQVGKIDNSIKIFPDLGREIEDILGLRDRNSIYNMYLPIQLNNYSVTDITVKNIHSRDEIIGFHPVEISGGFHSLFLYTDIVYPSLVGDTFANLLRVVEIPRKYKFGETVHKEYPNPQYRPVRLNEFETIEISIKDDSGMSIPFKFGRINLTLHLKQR